MKKLNEINISGVSLPLYAFIVIVLAGDDCYGETPTQYAWTNPPFGRHGAPFLLYR